MFASTHAPSEPVLIDLTVPERRIASPANPMESPPASPPPPSSPLNPHPLFDHPDLLSYLLDDPAMALTNLLSLARVNRHLRDVVQKRLFRTISLPTPNAALRLSTLLLNGSPILKHVEQATLALGVPLEMTREAFELVEVKPARLAAQAARGREGGGEATLALNKLVIDVVNDAFDRWPFVEGRGAAFVDLFFDLASTVTELNIAAPLSHYLLEVLPIFSKSTSIRSLHLKGARSPTVSSLVGAGTWQLWLPKPFVQVRPGKHGVHGGPATTEEFEARQMIFLLPAYKDVKLADKPWQLRRLALDNAIVVDSQGVSLTAPRPLAQLTRGPSDGDPEQQPFPFVEPLPQFDLTRLVGASTPSLTSLSLVNIDGVCLSSVNSIIRQSGPVLRDLALHNVSVGTSSFYQDKLGESFDYRRQPRNLHVFSGQGVQQEPDFSNSLQLLATAASRLSSSSNLSPFPLSPPTHSTTLSNALSNCTALTSLRLTSSSNPSSPTSAFPPSLLPSLRSARPPLRKLEWDVAVEGPRAVDDWLDVNGWRGFAEGVEEVRAWSMMSECEVVATLW